MQVSTYFVLDDANFDLEDNSIKRFTVEMPPSNRFVKATARPLLWFDLHPLTDRVKFLVILNDPPGDSNVPASKVVFNYDFDGSKHKVRRGIHEVLDGNQFNPGVNNTIDFRVIIGKARFSDVVLFFRIET